jgi:glyoxylase-like metal-dependent hydrolase (beta-lactamase superfamily II)
LTINTVQANASADLPIPDNVQAAAAPAVKVDNAKLGDGVWFLSGGTHHSLVVEFKDYIAVIEGPLNEERSMAVLAEAKKLVPNKPVKYVISTHHHFDHSGGLRTYVAEGATVVTHESNKPFFEKTFQAPATLEPDAQSKVQKPATFQTVSDKWVLTDGKQRIEQQYSTAEAERRDHCAYPWTRSRPDGRVPEIHWQELRGGGCSASC